MDILENHLIAFKYDGGTLQKTRRVFITHRYADGFTGFDFDQYAYRNFKIDRVYDAFEPKGYMIDISNWPKDVIRLTQDGFAAEGFDTATVNDYLVVFPELTNEFTVNVLGNTSEVNVEFVHTSGPVFSFKLNKSGLLIDGTNVSLPEFSEKLANFVGDKC